MKSTPAGRDLIAPYCEALREQDIKVGIYFTNTDWSDIDHLSVILDMPPEEIAEVWSQKYNYKERWNKIGSYEHHDVKNVISNNRLSIEECKEPWDRFMTRYKGEIEELLTKYGDIDFLWFDVMIERQGCSWESENVKKWLIL